MSKLEIIEATMKSINKNFGNGSIMKLSSTDMPKMERISSGVLPVDIITGGGYPLGRIIEIYGPESSGKTTITLKAIASCQKAGGTCVFIDTEHALDPVYAKNLGVDIDNLYISQPDYGEMALDIVETLVRSGSISLIVVDSVAALTPKAEIDGDMGDSHVGLQARLMSQAMRKLTGIISQSKTIVIFTNQIREKVGVMFGSPETTTGGRALKFYASIRIDVRKKDPIKKGTDIIGNETKIKTVKNKTAPPFREAIVDIIFGQGTDDTRMIIDYAVEKEWIGKSGKWYTLSTGERFDGLANIQNALKENENVYNDLKRRVYEDCNKKEENEQPLSPDEFDPLLL